MTIWIAHEPRNNSGGINLATLHEYADGEKVEYIFPKTFNISQNSDVAMAAAETFAAKYDFTNDQFAVVGGDPVAGLLCMAALVHNALEVNAKSIRSFRFVRERDTSGTRSIAKYIPITIPTGV